MTMDPRERLQLKFSEYSAQLQSFLESTLCQEAIDHDLYIEGSKRIEYIKSRRVPTELRILDPIPPDAATLRYEEALFQRLIEPRSYNLLMVMGGLGAGKTTTATFVRKMMVARKG